MRKGDGFEYAKHSTCGANTGAHAACGTGSQSDFTKYGLGIDLYFKFLVRGTGVHACRCGVGARRHAHIVAGYPEKHGNPVFLAHRHRDAGDSHLLRRRRLVV